MTKKKVVWSAAIAWALLVIVAFAALYGVATFSYTRLGPASFESGTSRTEEFRWNGGPILIERPVKSGKKRSLACQVYPARGEDRTVSFSNLRRSKGYVTREPWFAGSATMRCDSPVEVYSGSGYHMYLLAHSRLFQVGVAVLAVVPLVVVFLLASGVKASDLKAALPRRR